MSWSTLPASTKRMRQRSKKKAKEIRDSRPTVAAVLSRDGGCVLRSRPDLAGECFGEIHAHHLRKQSKRRGDWRPQVLVACCDSHNDGWIEGHPIEARDAGLVIKDGDSERDAWRKMRAAGLAVGELWLPCPGADSTPLHRREIQDVAVESGVASCGQVHHELVKLRNAGLVDWAPDTAGTLRPLVAPIVDQPATPRLDDGTVDVRGLCRLYDDACNGLFTPTAVTP